jgi:hypothetical protein
MHANMHVTPWLPAHTSHRPQPAHANLDIIQLLRHPRLELADIAPNSVDSSHLHF